MAALPYMQLYVADYLADTAHLSAIEHGAYLLLIMNYWQRGKPLPADDQRLARIARLSEAEWGSIGTMLSEFFEERDGHWHHKRIDADLAAVEERSQKARASRAQRTSNERKTTVERASNHKDTDTDTDSTSNEDTKTRARRTPVLLILCKVVSENRAKALVQHRTKIKAGLTEHTAKLLAGTLSQAADPNAAADEMMLRGWKSWKPDWSSLEGNRSTGPPPSETTGQRMLREAQEIEANGQSN